MSENEIRIGVVCSKCGNESTIPKYNAEGLPYKWYRCICDEETVISFQTMNEGWWSGVWMALFSRMKKEFGDSVAERMREYIIERQGDTPNQDRLHEIYVPPQSLQGSAKTEEE